MNVTKEAPYMVSFEVVNLFDVLRFKTNTSKIFASVTQVGKSGDDVLMEAIVDDGTSFILIKNQKSGTVRIQVIQKIFQIPNRWPTW